MNKHCKSTSRYRSAVHPSLLPSPVSDTTDYFQQIENSHRQICHCHNQHRNNHNSNLIQYDQLLKSIPSRKRQNQYYYQSDKKFSLVTIYINNILLILIRLMILFIAILIISFTFYSIIIYFYSKPKMTGWKWIIDWFYQE
jgi:hypothetical protein